MSATVGSLSDESRLVARLSLEQKVHLLTGADGWTLYPESAIGLRPLVMSDGPAGVRGTRFDPADPSTSLPCPVAIAATWDVDLVERLAVALGHEARSKGVDVLLAPTINIIRTPLSGRGFECFSEDPLLTSRMAVAYVRGVQSAGVGATAKHFVANDSETERRTYDARISEQVLREVYLSPFEACVLEAGVYVVMAAYNSVNGATMTENEPLLRGLLKGEWGFDGLVVSDWSATTSTAPSARAGLDLVMPGPDGPWAGNLLVAVRAGEVAESAIDDKVARLLRLSRRTGALNGGHQPAPAPRLIDAALLHEVTARSFVVLTNPRRVLPLKPTNVRSIALVGPNAIDPQTQGGGSVRVLASRRVDLAASIQAAMPRAQVTADAGCVISSTVALPREGALRDPITGKPGVRLVIRTADGETAYDAPFPRSVVTWWDGLPEALHEPGSSVHILALYTPDVDGPHVIGAAGVGAVRISSAGKLLAEETTRMSGDVVEALSRPPELRARAELEAQHDVEVEVELVPYERFVTLRLGIAPDVGDGELIEQAVRSAGDADVAVVVVGSADGTESEGYDRQDLALPGRQDELVTRVAAANPNTIVVVNSGMPVLMPWADHVAAIVQAWFPGQAFGEALADALLGVVEPSGRLPLSMPRAEADSPVLHALPADGELPYVEGALVGYRGYDRAGVEPLFAFGHGLGYTTWTYESIAAGPAHLGEDVGVTVAVRNTGGRAGREVVQVYVEGPDGEPAAPLRALGAFAVVDAEMDEQVEARMSIPARAFMRFNESNHGWLPRVGTYTIWAGRSSRDLRLNLRVEVE